MTKIQKWSVRFLKVLCAIICIIIAFNVTQPVTPSKKDIERKVRVACIVEIKKRLKHPSSMEIINRSVMAIGENKWGVEIGVQVKNDFGAVVPLNFVCDVYLEDGEYKLENMWRH